MKTKEFMERMNYRRVWVKGHYRYVTIKIRGNKKKKVRKWFNGYWREIKIKPPKYKMSKSYKKKPKKRLRDYMLGR